MSACETCWNDAYTRARMRGGTQVDNYYALLAERAADHDAQTTETRCGGEETL